MRICLFLTLCLASIQGVPAQTQISPQTGDEHFRIYRSDGSAATFDDLVAASRQAAVTFVGEVHDDPTGHQLELRLLQQVGSPSCALGMEMFERDVQPVIDEYWAGLINEENFVSSARAWSNYKVDYRPAVEFAREHKVPLVATNAPRRYVNRVSRLGTESLSALPEAARDLLAPVPYLPASAAYAVKFRKEMEDHTPPSVPSSRKPASQKEGQSAPPMPPLNITHALQAQSVWDATMAFSLAEYLTRHPGFKVLHVNGSFHSSEHLGIVEQLEQYRPDTRALVVTMIPAEKPLRFAASSMKNQGDFVIVTEGSLIQEKVKKDPGGSKQTN